MRIITIIMTGTHTHMHCGINTLPGVRVLHVTAGGPWTAVTFAQTAETVHQKIRNSQPTAADYSSAVHAIRRLLKFHYASTFQDRPDRVDLCYPVLLLSICSRGQENKANAILASVEFFRCVPPICVPRKLGTVSVPPHQCVGQSVPRDEGIDRLSSAPTLPRPFTPSELKKCIPR